METGGGYWAFHAPNLLLAMLMWTLLGRFMLNFIFADDSDKVIWRVFKQITDPFLAAVAFVTPALVPGRLLVLIGFVWCLILRMMLLLLVTMFGLAPKLGL